MCASTPPELRRVKGCVAAAATAAGVAAEIDRGGGPPVEVAHAALTAEGERREARAADRARHRDDRRGVRGGRRVRREPRRQREGVAPPRCSRQRRERKLRVARRPDGDRGGGVARVGERQRDERGRWFSGCVPKLAVVAEPVAQASVAPVGVTESGMVADACAGSLVVSESDPLIAVPAVEDPGTTALTAIVPVCQPRR